MLYVQNIFFFLESHCNSYSHKDFENQMKIPVPKFSEMELVPIIRYLKLMARVVEINSQ